MQNFLKIETMNKAHEWCSGGLVGRSADWPEKKGHDGGTSPYHLPMMVVTHREAEREARKMGDGGIGIVSVPGGDTQLPFWPRVCSRSRRAENDGLVYRMDWLPWELMGRGLLN